MYLKGIKQKNLSKKHLKQFLASILGIYILLVFAFYFLCGYQLHFRPSRGNFEMPVADSGTAELTNGQPIEQIFQVKIQRLQSISVQWGNYFRASSGNVYVALYDLRNQALLMEQTLNTADIADGMVTTMTAEAPIENIYMAPLLLRIEGNIAPGSGVTVLMSTATEEEGFSLFSSSVQVPGTLCFSVKGEDYIWTGKHYWQLALGSGVLLSLYLLLTYRRWKQGKGGVLLNALMAVNKYRFLIKQLVSRDFKAKYKRSVLGIFWSFLNPLLTMSVQYVVFSNMFRFDIPYYPVYLLSGIIIFNYFSEACGMALISIIGNASLITKVYVPKYIFPLTRVLSSLVNLLISMIPLFIIAFFSGLRPTKAYLLIPFVLLCVTLFCLGLGLLLAAAMVFFRDIQFLWGVLTMIWMYLTPIFYPESILPQQVVGVLKINPLYYFINFLRSCVIDGISPEPVVYVQCFLIALGFLIVGSLVFKHSQDKFILYL